MHYGSYGTDEEVQLIEKPVSIGSLVNARASFAFDDPTAEILKETPPLDQQVIPVDAIALRVGT